MVGEPVERLREHHVAHVAALHGLPVLEVRTISNEVGLRDRTSWDLVTALTDPEPRPRLIDQPIEPLLHEPLPPPSGGLPRGNGRAWSRYGPVTRTMLEGLRT